MADDPINQQQFDEDVAASAAAGDGQSFAPDGGFQMPSVDEVWKLIEQMEGISDEERENLRESLYNPQQGSPDDFTKRYAGQPSMERAPWDYYIFFAMIAIVLLVFALFGYKLYKSVMEKEIKKQEKLKSKLSKKAKKSN